jgi:hypothetical protein
MNQDSADVREALWFDRKRKPHCFGLGMIVAEPILERFFA